MPELPCKVCRVDNCEKMLRYFANENEDFSHKLVIFIAQKQGILSVQRMKSACRSPVGDELSVRSHLLPSTRDLSSSLRTEPVHAAPSWIFFIEKQKEKFLSGGCFIWGYCWTYTCTAQSTPVPLLSLSMSAPIYWRGHIHILNRRGGSNLQDDYSVYMASPN